MEGDTRNFLEYIDDKYNRIRIKECIQKDNKEFAIFQKIKPMNVDINNNYIIYKQHKSKLLFCPNRCKVYLTDQDIINIFINAEESISDSILNKLIDLYKGNGYKFKFKIDDKLFDGIGISYETSGKEKILLYTDNEIEINELIFIINIILEKDRLYNLQDKTLIKYITLIKYYRYQDENAKKFLEEIGYFTIDFNIKEKTYDAKKLKDIDKKFLNKGLIFKKYMII